MKDFKKITESWSKWLISEQNTPAKKIQITAGKVACRYYTNLKSLGLPENLHPFHLTSAMVIPNEKGQKVAIAFVSKAITKDSKIVHYVSLPVAGATGRSKVLQKGGQAVIFKSGLDMVLQSVLQELKLSNEKYELKWSPENDKWDNFSAEVASGQQSVDYCKNPTKKQDETTPKIETDDICNNDLVLKVQKSYSKRLPGVKMKNASPKIILSVCKIQRALHGLLGNRFPKSEIDGVIGPVTMKGLQRAYHLTKPQKVKKDKNLSESEIIEVIEELGLLN